VVEALLAFALLTSPLSVPQDLSGSVRTWVEQLGAKSRSQRLRAQVELLAMGPKIHPILAVTEAGDSFEERRQLAYILEKLVAPAEVCTIPAGDHAVGSPDPDDRNPERTVTLPEMTLDTTEVTNFEYYRFVRATGVRPPREWAAFGGRYKYGEERLPVRNVSFQDAGRFAAWVGGRLPTHDEWEVAGHAGKAARFPWGSEAPPSLRNSSGSLRPVRSEPRDVSPIGCYDMAASVSEWVVLEDGTSAYRGGHYVSREVWWRVNRGAVPVPSGTARLAVGFRVANRGKN